MAANIPVCQTPPNTVTVCSSSQANCFALRPMFSSLVPPNAYKPTRPTHLICQARKEEVLVVVGGGAAGVYGAIHAKTVAPHLTVVVIEKGKPLSKVKVSGGGRCNVTNGHCDDNLRTIQGVTRN